MDEREERQRQAPGGFRFLVLNVVTTVLTAVLAVALLLSTHSINVESDALQQTNERYVACELAANDLLDASTYLTMQSRLFSTTHHTTYLDNYFWAMSQIEKREEDVNVLNDLFPGSDAAEYLEMALEFAKKLSKNELYAMKLVVHALDLDIDEDKAAQLDALAFVRGDEGLSSEEMLAKAHMLVTYEPYEHDVDRVAQQVERCKDELSEMLAVEKQQHAETLKGLFIRQQVLTCLLLALVVFTAVVFIFTVFRPLNEYIGRIGRNERLDAKGSYELQFLANSYNTMYEENQIARDRLTFEAEHDSLTGLLNRGAFEKDINASRTAPMALVIIDIDHFKEVNDRYGHNIGDLALQRTASLLGASFEPGGTPYRLGGDEFVVIVPGQADELREVIMRNSRKVANGLVEPEGEVPAVGISAGVAFGDGTQVSGALYKYADQALYRAKGEGRQGVAFNDEDTVHPF